MLETVHPARRLELDLSPIEVVTACRALPGLVFFDSALDSPGSDQSGQISIIAAQPDLVLSGSGPDDWNRLRSEIASRQIQCPQDDGLPHGFAAGYAEYEGSFCFGFYQNALVFRHSDESWHELGTFPVDPATLAGLTLSKPNSQPDCQRPLFRPSMDKERFCQMVVRAQEYIAAGDIYQVNLAHQFHADWSGDVFALYEALRHYSPAPFAALLALDERTILSTSPESFLKISGRSIRTRPIKGTRPRRSDPKADEKSAYDLITSAKEIAELVMITDLERNDLGTVCDYGSVHVSELLKLERYEHVFHLASTVHGRLRPGIDHVQAFQACFPGGSITGAPKKRAREIIAELEPCPRGPYTGAVGWFGFNGESQFNIAIRTVVAEPSRLHFHVGAGIVADSLPEKEWQETLDKAAGILMAAERMVVE